MTFAIGVRPSDESDASADGDRYPTYPVQLETQLNR
jgi:hypothetical protein